MVLIGIFFLLLEVINNNVCVDYNHESDESTNRYISDSIEAFPPKTPSVVRKRG